MIDAVSNTSSVSAGVTQRSVPQASVSSASPGTLAAAVTVQSSPVGTPRIRIDNNLDMAIIEYRSAEGDIVHQYPTEAQIQAFSRAAEIEARVEQTAQDVAVDAPAAAADTPDVAQPDAPATSAEAAPATSVNVTADGGSVPAYSSSTQVVTA